MGIERPVAIAPEKWATVRDPSIELPAAGTPLAFGFDAAIDRSDATIVVAWFDERGRPCIEVADHRPATGWLAPRIAELATRWTPLAIGAWMHPDRLSTWATSSRAEEVALLVPTTTRAFASACAALLRRVDDGELRVANHPARWRRSGRLLPTSAPARARCPGAWLRDGRADVSLAPLAAATLALYTLEHVSDRAAGFRIF